MLRKREPGLMVKLREEKVNEDKKENLPQQMFSKRLKIEKLASNAMEELIKGQRESVQTNPGGCGHNHTHQKQEDSKNQSRFNFLIFFRKLSKCGELRKEGLL